MPIDINDSEWNCTLEPSEIAIKSSCPLALRLGMRLIRGFSQSHADLITDVRGDHRFRSLDDFAKRTRLNQSVIVRLSQADCFASLGQNRRKALWEALGQERSASNLPLFQNLPAEDDSQIELPPMESSEDVFADYDSTGLSLKAHPVSFYRSELDQISVRKGEGWCPVSSPSFPTPHRRR